MAWKRFICAFDVHGDMQDKAAVRVFHKFCEDHWKPHLKIMGGDLWDFRSMRKGASPEEQADRVTADFQAGNEFLSRFQPHVFLRGNHDERLWEMAERTQGNGLVIDYCLHAVYQIEADMRAMHCTMHPYDKRQGVYRVGALHVVHGFRSGITAAKATCMDYGACTLMGHIHAVDRWSAPGLDRRAGWASGALCQLDMGYNARQPNTLRQSNGFAYGQFNDKTGAFSLSLAERINGEWSLNEKPLRMR
jgi:UDP-2,3-diacylglucosamine pyrophosphatase LpxH